MASACIVATSTRLTGDLLSTYIMSPSNRAVSRRRSLRLQGEVSFESTTFRLVRALADPWFGCRTPSPSSPYQKLTSIACQPRCSSVSCDSPFLVQLHPSTQPSMSARHFYSPTLSSADTGTLGLHTISRERCNCPLRLRLTSCVRLFSTELRVSLPASAAGPCTLRCCPPIPMATSCSATGLNSSCPSSLDCGSSS